MWTILVWPLAMIGDQLSPVGIFETRTEYATLEECEKVINNDKLAIELPENFDPKQLGVTTVEVHCIEMSDVPDYFKSK